MKRLSLNHRPTFRNNYVQPALKMGLIEMTEPDAPRSPAQRYRLTMKGRSVLFPHSSSGSGLRRIWMRVAQRSTRP